MTDVFRVGDREILASEIPRLLKRYQLMPQFLQGLVVDRAIADYSCTDEEKQAALQQFCQQHQLTSPEAQQGWLKAHGMTPAELEEIAVRPVLLQKFKEDIWGNKVRSHFMTRKSSLDRVIYSLIRTKDDGLAQELYYRIQEGEQTFEECARDYSQGPEARTGGKLGPVPLNRPHPAIGKLLSVSQPGQLWPPRALAEWFIIVRLEEFHPAQLDDTMRSQMLDELYASWMQAELQKLVSAEFDRLSSLSPSA
ncbi:peptidylprolyl isomerase [Leptolyngbya valderiana BDU 20041]|uniref:peptidylprolyl isomerase n=1 Tax=Baaleninema simplex TaxID=2862350 RepID=UPI000346BB4B|nr:peptidylprolyl isomerase [Baaleninema simplex]MDC0832831.1 peptidylprolyl isomerase [Geitlerinema sp. CS-897]OAB63444.1 peptidylprolyl isomerase [Leptolyngbya valderiana BDU 20041]